MQNMSVVLIWIPSYNGNYGNKMADHHTKIKLYPLHQRSSSKYPFPFVLKPQKNFSYTHSQYTVTTMVKYSH